MYLNLLDDNSMLGIAWTAFLPEVGPDPDNRSRLRQDSAFFLRIRSQNFGKNRSHFSILAVAGVCVVIS